MLKFLKVIPSKKMDILVKHSNWIFRVYINNKSSRAKSLNNDLAQGSVLCSTLFQLVHQRYAQY